jgi:hypothetical protein
MLVLELDKGSMAKPIKNVGDLMDELKFYPRKTPVFCTQYIECITDAGTDMGGNEECQIKAVVDLESRLVIEIERYS